MSVKFHLSGIPKLDKWLRHMEKPAARRIARSAISAGLQVVNKAMRADAPKGRTGNLRKSIGKENKRDSKRNMYDGIVGVNVRRRTAPHNHLVVFGTKPRRTTSGAYRGVMPQNRFVEEVWDRERQAAFREMVNQARKKVVEEARK